VLTPQQYDFANKAQNLRDLMDTLADFASTQDKQARNFYAFTPLANSIHDVAHDPVFKKATGFKTILVLTDGDDTVSKEYFGEEPGRVVQDALQGTDISLQIVLFKPTPTEEKHAKEQFSLISSLPTPGRMWNTNDPNELIQHLRNAMQPHVSVFRER